MFSKWIHSHRDLPLKINQWANIIRWEMRTRPFLRTSEFLWQEGHTAHASSQEAKEFSKTILDLYAQFVEEILAIPVIKGEKSPSERFAGAENTFTIEAMMGNGWALQSGTSHYLGQNFAEAFDVFFQNEQNQRELVWATSWGVSTRLIGALIMTHSDDKGLVLPPRIAPIQVVIVPIITGKEEKDKIVLQKCRELQNQLSSDPFCAVRCHVDDRKSIRHGAKYFEWERKGVPLRIDVGMKDLEKGRLPMTVRFSGEKLSLPLSDEDYYHPNRCENEESIVNLVRDQLKSIQQEMFSQAKKRNNERLYQQISSYEEMKKAMEETSSSPLGFYLVPWKDNTANEEFIKKDCKATIRCFPFEDQNNNQTNNINLTLTSLDGKKCFYSGEPATHWAIFARAF
jgi:prolyl-tRNA synthetase